jgi:hypothetical protein
MRTNNPSIPKGPQWLQKKKAHSVRLRQDRLSPSGSPLRNCLPLGHHCRFLPLARSLWIETSNPVLGGLFIGGAQAASLTLTRGPIGVSTPYERLGDYICRFTGISPCNDSTWPSPSPLVIALGMPVGTLSLSNALGMTPAMETTRMSVARATVGGVALIIGARIAGGCTSGHGISGMAALDNWICLELLHFTFPWSCHLRFCQSLYGMLATMYYPPPK